MIIQICKDFRNVFLEKLVLAIPGEALSTEHKVEKLGAE
jgi:hypothetical protein